MATPKKEKNRGIENLKPFKSVDEARENGRKGGIKSGEAKREKKAFKEVIIERLDKAVADGKTTKEALICKLVDKIQEDKTSVTDLLRALEFLRDSSGEKPTDKVEQTTLTPLTPEQRKQIAKDFGFE